MWIKAISSAYGGVGDMLDIATGNFLLDLTHYGSFSYIFIKILIYGGKSLSN